MQALATVADVIEALGGITEVARLTGRKYDAAAADKARDQFPSHTYLVMTDALRARGFEAPASLWRMVETAQ